jgi:hypothetical protein
MSDHFLTDMFSAGHARTPRFELYAQCGSTVGGLYSNAQHDEENERGVIMKNKQNDQWLALGDSRLWDMGDKTNRKMVKKAVATSIRDVALCFLHGCNKYFSGTHKYFPLDALLIAPDLEHMLSHVEVGEPAPMFLLDDRCPATGRRGADDDLLDEVKGCNRLEHSVTTGDGWSSVDKSITIPKIWRRTKGCKMTDTMISTASGASACKYEELTCDTGTKDAVEAAGTAERLPTGFKWLVDNYKIKPTPSELKTKFTKADKKTTNFQPFKITI